MAAVGRHCRLSRRQSARARAVAQLFDRFVTVALPFTQGRNARIALGRLGLDVPGRLEQCAESRRTRGGRTLHGGIPGGGVDHDESVVLIRENASPAGVYSMLDQFAKPSGGAKEARPGIYAAT